MPIPQVPSQLMNILASKTYNAAWFSGTTVEQQIQNAITTAVADGATAVFVPASMWPYNMASIVFNDSVKMIREGGIIAGGVWDASAYGGIDGINVGVAYTTQQAVKACAANGGGTVDMRGFTASPFTLLETDICALLAVYDRTPITFMWGAQEVRVKYTQTLRSHHHHILNGTLFISKDELGARVLAKTMFLHDRGTVGLGGPGNGVLLTDASGVITKKSPTSANWAYLEVGSPIGIFGRLNPLGKDNTTINIGGGINDSTTSITVASTTKFPSSGYIRIEDEVIFYTNIDATHFLDCTRGSNGSIATSHADTTAVERCMYEPFFVESVSGNDITLGDGQTMDMTTTAGTGMNCTIGPLDIKFDGTGTFDGNKDPANDDPTNPGGIDIRGGRHCYIGPGLVFKNFDHFGVNYIQMQDSWVYGHYSKCVRGGTPNVGVSVWVFGRNKRVTADITCEDSFCGVGLDDRSVVAQFHDGANEDCTIIVRNARRVDRGISMGGSQRCYMEVKNDRLVPSGGFGILFESGSQWVTNIGGSGNVGIVGAFDTSAGASAITVDSGFSEQNNTIILPLAGGGGGAYSVPEPASVSGLLIMRPSRATSATYGTTVTPDVKTGDTQLIIVTNGTAFTIANALNPFNGALLTICVFNNSGGAMGAITWGSQYKLAGAFTNPANGQRRYITFERQGLGWRERSRSAADQPN